MMDFKQLYEVLGDLLKNVSRQLSCLRGQMTLQLICKEHRITLTNAGTN